jgi:hypothetical protein
MTRGEAGLILDRLSSKMVLVLWPFYELANEKGRLPPSFSIENVNLLDA